MVLIDTSIWVDFFQYPESSYTERLENLIKDNNKAVICGIIIQEVLQGIKDEKSYLATKERLSKFPFIVTNRESYFFASSLYRSLRNKGITVPPVDVTIASIAILNKIPFFTKDSHFSIIAKYADLELY
ncbi:MAG: PIN domain nuclease [bacterium]